MKIVENNDVSACVKNLKLEVEPDQLHTEIEKTYDEFSKNVDVPGFRRGRAPRKILKMRYSKHLEKQAVQQAAEEACEKAIEELGLKTSSQPVVEELGDVEEGKSFTFTVSVEHYPEFELAEYTDVKPDVDAGSVPEKEIVEQLEELRKQAASYNPPAEARPAQQGDLVSVNTTATREGEPFPEATVENITIELGSGHYLPGLEDGLIGANDGDKKEIEITLPDDYPVEANRGQTIVIAAEVLEIKECILPEMDDEFAKDLGDFESLDDLKSHIQKRLEENSELRVREAAAQQAREELLQRNQFPIPPSMIEARFNYINSVQNMDNRLSGSEGAPAEDQESGLHTKNRDQAEKESRLTLILDEIAKREKLEITPEEYASYITQLAQRGQSDPVWYYQQIERYKLRPYYERLALEEKVVAHVLDLGSGKATSVAQEAEAETAPEDDSAEAPATETQETEAGTETGDKDSGDETKEE